MGESERWWVHRAYLMEPGRAPLREATSGMVEVVRADAAVDHMRESRIARARGLALAIAECRDDARLDGIREGAAEIAELLAGRA